MKHVVLLATIALAGSWVGQATAAYPFTRLEQRIVCNGTEGCAWNAPYYNPAWGAPVALVVPPTVCMETSLGSTVGGSHVNHVCPQFGQGYPGGSIYGRTFQPAPVWPTDTRQMGYYYVRGPWR